MFSQSYAFANIYIYIYIYGKVTAVEELMFVTIYNTLTLDRTHEKTVSDIGQQIL